MSTDMAIAASELVEFTGRLFAAVGVPEADAAIVAQGLVDADLEGHGSHGVMLVEMYLNRIRMGSVSPDGKPTIVSEQGVATVIDARHVLGHLSGDQAMAVSIERAHRLGAGVKAV